MSEQREVYGGARAFEEGLAKAFDQICTLADMTHQEHVIAWHMERPEAFKWFVEGVMYERAQRQVAQVAANKPLPI